MGKWVALVAENTVAGDLVSVYYEYRDALRPKVSSLLPRVRGRAETSRQAAVLWFFGFGFCCLLLPSQGWPCSAMGVCLLLRKHSWWVRVLQCCGNSWWAWPEFFRTRRWRQTPGWLSLQDFRSLHFLSNVRWAWDRGTYWRQVSPTHSLESSLHRILTLLRAEDWSPGFSRIEAAHSVFP